MKAKTAVFAYNIIGGAEKLAKMLHQTIDNPGNNVYNIVVKMIGARIAPYKEIPNEDMVRG